MVGLNRWRVLVMPATNGQASRAMKLDSWSDVMQMTLRTGVSMTV